MSKKASADEAVKVKWLKTQPGGVIQIYDTGLEYAFVSAEMKQCHALVTCKDFLQGAAHAACHKKSFNLHRFGYDPKKQPAVDLDALRLVVANKADPEFGKKLEGAVDFVNQVAKELGLKRAKVERVSNPLDGYEAGGMYVVTGSARWLNAPPLLSMFALLLRTGLVHTPKGKWRETLDAVIKGRLAPYCPDDRDQCEEALKGIDRITGLGYRRIFYIDTAKNYPDKVDPDTMHVRSGIVSFALGHTKSLGVDYWHRKSLDTPKKVAAAEADPGKPPAKKAARPRLKKTAVAASAA